MKELPLRNGKMALVDDDVFDWAKNHKWYESFYGYAICNMGYGRDGRYTAALHQLIIGKAPKGRDIDHINQNPLDNRRENLRFVTRKLNCLNTAKRKWVIQHQGKWRVRFKVGDLEVSVSSIETEEQALSIAALLKGAIIYHELTKGG